MLLANRALIRLVSAFSAVTVAEWGFVTAMAIHAYRLDGRVAVGLVGVGSSADRAVAGLAGLSSRSVLVVFGKQTVGGRQRGSGPNRFLIDRGQVADAYCWVHGQRWRPQ
jgi:hypothetical protein